LLAHLTTQDGKASALREYYSAYLGTPPPRDCTLNWDELLIQQHDLSDLENDLTEEEIRAAVMQTPPEKVPGSDGYIGTFYKLCWDIIGPDGYIGILCLESRLLEPPRRMWH
jgi:hypothetical protein